MSSLVQATSIVDAIAQDLREQLYGGKLEGNESLTEVSVSARYDVARPTAKAAIEKLVSEGLLIRGQHKTARVPVIGPDDVRDIYITRRRLESEAVRSLAGKGLVPEEARLANADLKLRAGETALAIVEPDMRLHTSLIDAVSSPRLSKMYRTLVGEVRLCMSQVQGKSLLSVESIAGEHERLLELIEQGDAEGAVELLEVHLSRARERLVGAMGGEAGPEARLAYTVG